MANISLPVPGVVKHEYIDAPLAPQVSIINVKYLIETRFYLFFGFWSLFNIFKKGAFFPASEVISQALLNG